MKKLVLFLFTIVLLSSCKKNLTDVEFSTTLSKTSEQIDVNSGPIKAVVSNYATTFVVDLSNSDTQDYINKIKDIELENVRFIFEGLAGLSGNATPTTLKITINNQVTLTYNDFVYDRVANGQGFVIDDMQKVNEMAALLQSAKKLTIKIEGTIPDTAMYQFFIKFMAKANIKASIL